jgi:hypothetical protein
MPRKGRSKEEEIIMEMALLVHREAAKIKRPYDRRKAAELGKEDQAKFLGAEGRLIVSVTGAIAGTDDDTKEWANEIGLDITAEKYLIDQPLQHMQELAAAYAETGLAADEAAAKRMAAAFKDSVVQHFRQMRGKATGIA